MAIKAPSLISAPILVFLIGSADYERSGAISHLDALLHQLNQVSGCLHMS